MARNMNKVEGPGKLIVEDLKILPGRFRHFSGEKDAFNGRGDINFCAEIPYEHVERMISDGWNIKVIEAKDADSTPTYFLRCKVNFNSLYTPPIVELVQERNGRYVSKTQLDEETIKCLDHAEIEKCDLILNPYRWQSESGESGITAYVERMVVVIKENRFDSKYTIEEDPDSLPF